MKITIPVIILTLLTALCQTQLTNRDEVGQFLRDALWKIGDHVKNLSKNAESPQNLSQNDPNDIDLFSFSYRGLTFEVLKMASYDQQENTAMQNLVINAEQKLEAYRQLSKAPDFLNPEAIKNRKQMADTFQRLGQQKSNKNNLLNGELNREMEVLKGFADQLTADNNFFVPYYNMVSTIISVRNQVKVVGNDENAIANMHSKITGMKGAEEIAESLTSYYNNVFDLNNLEKVVKTLSGISGYSTNAWKSKSQGLAAELKQGHQNIEKQKKTLVNLLDQYIETMTSQLVSIKQYKGFVNSMINVRSIKKRITDAKKAVIVNQRMYQRMMVTNQLKGWMRFRLKGTQRMSLEESLDNLNTAVEFTQPQFNIEELKSKKYYTDLLAVLSDNKQMQAKLNNRIQVIEQMLKFHEELVQIFVEIDVKFARIVSDLMNPQGKDNIYFSAEEISVLMYYMNMSKVFFSQSSFLTAFLLYLDTGLCKNVVARIKMDLDSHNSAEINDALCEVSSTQVATVAPSEFVKEYALFMSNQKSLLFQKLLNQQATRKSKFLSLMNFFRINKMTIIGFIQKKTLGIFFGKIAAGILIFIGIGTGVPLLSTILAAFISFLTLYVLDLIRLHSQDYDSSYQSFMRSMEKVYQHVSHSKFEEIDYMGSLQEFDKAAIADLDFLGHVKREDSEITEFFADRFESIPKHNWAVSFGFAERQNFLLV